jgi:hypothetical protein
LKLLSLIVCCFLLLLGKLGFTQDTTRFDKIISFPGKLFSSLNKKAAFLESKLDKQTDKYLSKLQRREQKLKNKLWRKDSTLAKQIFDGSEQKYAELKKEEAKVSKYGSVYSGHLDSISTALNFLKTNKIGNLSSNPELQKTLDQYKVLQGKLNQTDQVKKYIKQRQVYLKEQLSKVGMVKDLKKYGKDAYYYAVQVKEYKHLLDDPTKLEKKLLEFVMKTSQFKDFFARNSMLGSLFAIPGSSGTPNVSLAGLQTRAMVNLSIIDRFGNSAGVRQQLTQNVNAAQSQLNQLKNKVSTLQRGGYGNSSDASVPEFKPNNQKTKSFLKRLEWGTNFQSQRARYFFPVTADIGLSLGYKLNDKSVIGLGASYKLGLGSGWNHIALTHQGLGLRSYLDYKIKGALFISGGYEQNYSTSFSSIQQLKDYSAWQSSGLLGLSKKYKVSKKMNGEMKLLWDFLSYQQVPRTQAILFRIGYSLK